MLSVHFRTHDHQIGGRQLGLGRYGAGGLLPAGVLVLSPNQSLAQNLS